MNEEQKAMMTRTEWVKSLSLYFIIALIGWWMIRYSDSNKYLLNKYLLVAFLVGAVVVDLIIRVYLHRTRNKPNKLTRFLRTDTMPKTITRRELWEQVALATIFYLFLSVGGALFLIVAGFESLITPIIVAGIAFFILVPQRYCFIRRRYRQIEVQNESGTQHLLEFDADMKSIYGSKLLSALYVGLVMIVFIGLASWLNLR